MWGADVASVLREEVFGAWWGVFVEGGGEEQDGHPLH